MKLFVIALLLLLSACNDEDKRLFELNKSIIAMVEPQEYLNDFDKEWKKVKDKFVKSVQSIKDLDQEKIALKTVEAASTELINNYEKLVEILDQAQTFYKEDLEKSHRVKKIASFVDLNYINYLMLVGLKLKLVNRDIEKGADPVELVMKFESKFKKDNKKLFPLMSKFILNYKLYSQVDGYSYWGLQGFYIEKLGVYESSFSSESRYAQRTQFEINYELFEAKKDLWSKLGYEYMNEQEMENIAKDIQKTYLMPNVKFKDVEEYILRIKYYKYRLRTFAFIMKNSSGFDIEIHDVERIKRKRFNFHPEHPERYTYESMFNSALTVFALKSAATENPRNLLRVASIAFGDYGHDNVIEEYIKVHKDNMNRGVCDTLVVKLKEYDKYNDKFKKMCH